MANDSVPPPMPKPPVAPIAAPVAAKAPPQPGPPPLVPGGGVNPQNIQEPQEEEQAPPADFWQQPWVQNVLPFVSSVVVHAAILLIGVLFFMGGFAGGGGPPKHQEEVIVPDAAMVSDGPPGGVLYQGMGNDPNRQAFQDQVKDAGTPEGWAQKAGKNRQMMAPGGGEGDASDDIIATGPGGQFGHGKAGRGTGIGNAQGSGEGDGSGLLAPFGTPGGGGIGPKGPVFGHGGNAKRIAFVCDCSGSMLNKFSTLRRELSTTVNQLKTVQSFSIVFFSEGKPQVFDSSLINATPESKIKAQNFLENIIPRGTTDPIPGIEIAFKQKPELIYLLTDGDFPDNDKVLKTIRDLNKDHRVHINTIAFVGDADTDTDFMELLKKIAQENGGVYRHVVENEL